MARGKLEAAEVAAQRIARAVDELIPEGWGFTLHLVSFGAVGFATHLSNVRREDSIRMVQEWLERQKVDEFASDHTEEECWTCGKRRRPFVEMAGKNRSVLVCHDCWGTSRNATGGR